MADSLLQRVSLSGCVISGGENSVIAVVVDDDDDDCREWHSQRMLPG